MNSTSDHPPLRPGSIAAIVPAAGSGQRFGAARNKLFATLGDRPLWYWAMNRLRSHPMIGRIVMPTSPPDQAIFRDEYQSLVDQLDVEIVTGGAERTDSVLAGLEHVSKDPTVAMIAVHDAARPLVSSTDLDAVFAAANECGAAILACPVAGTVKRDLEHGRTCETVDRRELWIAMTPQVFQPQVLTEAYRRHNGCPATDDAQLVERAGHPVALVHGSADNLKITYPEDLTIAAAIMAQQSQDA